MCRNPLFAKYDALRYTVYMPQEIERKFLVTGNGYRKKGKPERLVQGYLSQDDSLSVRVRISGKKAFLTVKALARGVQNLAVRHEYEYAVPVREAEEMLALCREPAIEKTRYTLLESDGHTWEIDEFSGANSPLVVAEIELETEDEQFERPDWLGDEVTADKRFLNVHLAKHPFGEWKDSV